LALELRLELGLASGLGLDLGLRFDMWYLKLPEPTERTEIPYFCLAEEPEGSTRPSLLSHCDGHLGLELGFLKVGLEIN
jgi:hypothetical protein